MAEEARLSNKWSISSSFKCEPSNRLLKFVACVGATDSLPCKRLFAQTLYFPLSASYEDNIFTSIPSLKRELVKVYLLIVFMYYLYILCVLTAFDIMYVDIYRVSRRKGPNFGRVFLRSNYTDKTQKTYI